jgi:hypothetical protein
MRTPRPQRVPPSTRGYSRAFTPGTARRIKREIDRVPATLDARVQTKLAAEGVSLRAMTLTLWTMWVDGAVRVEGGR